MAIKKPFDEKISGRKSHGIAPLRHFSTVVLIQVGLFILVLRLTMYVNRYEYIIHMYCGGKPIMILQSYRPFASFCVGLLLFLVICISSHLFLAGLCRCCLLGPRRRGIICI